MGWPLFFKKKEMSIDKIKKKRDETVSLILGTSNKKDLSVLRRKLEEIDSAILVFESFSMDYLLKNEERLRNTVKGIEDKWESKRLGLKGNDIAIKRAKKAFFELEGYDKYKSYLNKTITTLSLYG